MDFSAGEFRVTVREGGYPVWVDVACHGVGFTMKHSELKDLQHVLERAAAAARRELRKSGLEDEMD